MQTLFQFLLIFETEYSRIKVQIKQKFTYPVYTTLLSMEISTYLYCRLINTELMISQKKKKV